MKSRFRMCLFVPVIVAACGEVPRAPVDALVRRTVTVQRDHTGSGTVTSTAGGIACGTVCTVSVPDGTVMSLSAVADDGAVFAGWTGPCMDTSPSCSFTVSSDVTVGAAFDMKRYTVTIEPAGNGTGTVTASGGALNCPAACSATVDQGTRLTLTAAAQAGSVFVGWSGSGCTGTGTCTILVGSDQNVTASFALTQSLVVVKTGSGTGTVTSSPAGIACGSDCTEVYPPGTVVTLTAAAAPTSHFVGWTGGGCSGTATCVVPINAAGMIEARFDRLCTLAVARLGIGGGIVTSSPPGIACGTDCTEDFVCGTTVQLVAAPNGSTFVGWSNGCTGNGACSITLTESTTVSATFTRCGNHVVEVGEQCDDGNTTNGDDCENDCTLPRCGNRIVDRGEQCDDGNAINGDDCENDCTLPRCGNRIVDRGEQCDDGNTTNGDDCENDCTLPRCGNGIVDRGERCDDGNTNDNDACDHNCQCGGVGQPCCASGPRCGEGSGCLASKCTTCPAPPVTTQRFFTIDSDGSNCLGVNNVHLYPVQCAPGTHREKCTVTPINPPSDTSCTFENWIVPNDESNCGCAVRFITSNDCFKRITCSVAITQTTNSPPHPDGCP